MPLGPRERETGGRRRPQRGREPRPALFSLCLSCALGGSRNRDGDSPSAAAARQAGELLCSDSANRGSPSPLWQRDKQGRPSPVETAEEVGGTAGEANRGSPQRRQPLLGRAVAAPTEAAAGGGAGDWGRRVHQRPWERAGVAESPGGGNDMALKGFQEGAMDSRRGAGRSGRGHWGRFRRGRGCGHLDAQSHSPTSISSRRQVPFMGPTLLSPDRVSALDRGYMRVALSHLNPESKADVPIDSGWILYCDGHASIWMMAGGGRAPVSDHRIGLFLSAADEPSDRSPYSGRCFLQDILQSQRPSWYDKFSVRRAHIPRPGATEWLQYVLQHYRHMLDLVGIRNAVTTALYRYPCYTGLIQAIVERYNSLPVIGEPYEEVVLDEFYRNSTDGQGCYEIEFCYRYLMKAWCDLAKARQSTSVVGDTDGSGTSRNTPKSLDNQAGLILGPNRSFTDLLRSVFAWLGFSARMWWNLFQQDDASLLVNTSSSTYWGVVTLKYADRWANHGGNFTQRSGAIRHLETRVGPNISLTVPSSEVPSSPHDGADGATFSPHISMHVDPASTVHAAPVEPLLSSLLSKDQNVEPMPSVSEARGGHSREDDVDDWDYELDVTDIPILNPNWDPSMENPEDPNFSKLIFSYSGPSSLLSFDHDVYLMRMMEEPLPTTDQGALQDITAAVEPTAAETTPFLSIEATSDQGNPLSVSTSIALHEEKSEPPAPSHPLLDPSVPYEEMGIPAKPLSQPSDSAVIGQDDLSSVPDPGETNNNGGDPFVPMSPALDLLVAIKKVKVAIKPSEHLSDVENSEVTSPLNASEPDSSDTCVISGDHSGNTEPLSGEMQQLSIAFEAACDAAELSSHPSLAASGLDRSPQALEVVEARLAALRSEAIGTAG
ncbi:hypothetical protein Taro_011458 [Colocasia esculenta]|uniref:Uncharacterized protein n=1 Tax=Colocasia esculenta TaxID=4460 RepID=A0A843UAW9_COLES|nr:hypothetical protein [Colocasia esculenta]